MGGWDTEATKVVSSLLRILQDVVRLETLRLREIFIGVEKKKKLVSSTIEIQLTKKSVFYHVNIGFIKEGREIKLSL